MNKFLLIFALIAALCACNTLGKAKEKPEEFTVDPESMQVPIGEMEIQFDHMMGIAGIKKYNVSVSYFPNEDAVCLEYKQDFITYKQFWSRSGRQAFCEALAKYNEDYDSRVLDKGTRNSKRKYGVTKGYLAWQQFRFSLLAKGSMNIELGFDFKDRAPYFTVTQMKAENIVEDELYKKDNYRVSPIMTMYFTRAQAAELEEFFSQEFLNEIAPNRIPSSDSPGTDRDEY